MKGFVFPFFWMTLLFVVNIVALLVGVYQRYPWFDVPMHFFGGYAVALLGIALYAWISERVALRATSKHYSRAAIVLLEGLVVIGLVMIVGVAWEIWEFLMDQYAEGVVGRFGASQHGMADTMGDFVNDGIGAVTAWVLWRKRS